MKRFFLLFLALTVFQAAYALDDEVLKIINLNTPTIKIGGKPLKAGDTFKVGSTIQWGDPDQTMECKGMSTGSPYRFSRKQFESKGAITSVRDYLLRLGQASTRDSAFQPVFKPGSKKDSFPEKRCALIIGNSNYSYISYLRNPLKDASDISNSLRGLGFDVMEGYDCNFDEMKTLMNVFSSKAHGYDVAIIYYSGHGLQEEGRNYLIPVDCQLERKSDLWKCVAAVDMVQKLEDTGCETCMLYLDACRNVKTSWNRSASEGLATMEGFPGMVIAFSTQNGRTASDGKGENSPFAEAFLNNVSSNATFPEMMSNVAKQTYVLTERVQFPVTVGSLVTDFRFNPAGGGAKTVTVRPEKRVEEKRVEERPVVSPGPKVYKPRENTVSFDDPDFDFEVKKVKRAAKNVFVTIQVTNNSGKNVRPLMIANESTSLGGSSAAKDNAGGYHSMSSMDLCVLEGDDRRFDSQYIAPWPSGVTTTFVVIVMGVSEDATALDYLSLSMRCVSRTQIYGIAYLQIKNIPL
jgi:hypothetical protein